MLSLLMTGRLDELVNPAVWTTIEPAVAIVAICLPSIRKAATPPPDFSRNPGALILYKPPPLLSGSGFNDAGAHADNANLDEYYDDGPELYATIEEVDDENDVQMMDIDG